MTDEDRPPDWMTFQWSAVVVGVGDVHAGYGTPTGGTFLLTFTDNTGTAQTTGAIAYNASAATVQGQR